MAGASGAWLMAGQGWVAGGLAGGLCLAAALCGVGAAPVIAQSDAVTITFKAATASAASSHRSGKSGAARKSKSKAAAKSAAKTADSSGISPPRAANNGDRLDNAAVLDLTQIGLGDPAIVAKIHASNPHFDITTPTLVALRRAGVSSVVLAAMIDAQSAASVTEVRPDSPDPRDPHPAGVYLLGNWLAEPRMLAIRPTVTTRTTSGSILGYAFSGGLASVSYRAILPSPHAGIVAGGARPTFYFFTGAATASQNLVSNWGAAPVSSDVALVRLDVTQNGREVRIGSFNIHGANTGVRAQDSIPFSAAEVAPGVEALRPDADLPNGEYGFIQTAGGVGVGAAQVSTSTARIFDFAVGSAEQGSREGALGNPAGKAAGPDTTLATIAAVESALIASERSSASRTPRVKQVKEPDSAPSLYPGGK